MSKICICDMIENCKKNVDESAYGQQQKQIAEWLEELERIKCVFGKTVSINLIDKNGRLIKTGDKVRIVLDNGEVRDFDVKFKTVIREVKNHPESNDISKVEITGIVFCRDRYEIFPCIDENGISDISRMEVINPDVY